jgi:hypothetical protein
MRVLVVARAALKVTLEVVVRKHRIPDFAGFAALLSTRVAREDRSGEVRRDRCPEKDLPEVGSKKKSRLLWGHKRAHAREAGLLGRTPLRF